MYRETKGLFSWDIRSICRPTMSGGAALMLRFELFFKIWLERILMSSKGIVEVSDEAMTADLWR